MDPALRPLVLGKVHSCIERPTHAVWLRTLQARVQSMFAFDAPSLLPPPLRRHSLGGEGHNITVAPS
eukprot:COSAG03_NODE_63_length_15223_cov_32.095940_4_plen_67_part_00